MAISYHDIEAMWARLASIPDLKRMREGERLLLLDDIQLVFFPWFDDAEAVERFVRTLPATHRGKLTKGDKQKTLNQEYLPRVLEVLHEAASRYISALLKGQEVALYPGHERIFLRLTGGKVTERQGNDNLEGKGVIARLADDLVASLIDIVRSTRPSFPFRMCRVCKKVFVPVKNQLYCTPTCAYRGTEGTRRETKRRYMRGYMARRRQQDQEQGKEVE